MTIYRQAWCAICQRITTFMLGQCLDCVPVETR